MAYIVALSDGTVNIAMCMLRDDWTVIAASLSAVSDMLAYADTGQVEVEHRARPADPRMVVLAGRLYMHFNAGPASIANQIYFVEIDIETLRPIGFARTVSAPGGRRSIEKNLAFFECNDEIFVIRQLAPLMVQRVDIHDPNHLVLTDAYHHRWDSWSYEHAYGQLGVGAAPVLHNGRYYVLGRSLFRGDGDKSLPDSENRCSVGALVVFAGAPPFAPKSFSARPVIELSPAERSLPHWSNPDQQGIEVAYPAGLVADDRSLIFSYGVNNTYAALRRIEWADPAAALIPAIPRSPLLAPARTWHGDIIRPGAAEEAAHLVEQDRLEVRAFWWRPGYVSPRSTERAANLARHRFVHGNFGDLFVPHLLGRLTGAEPQYHEDSPKLLTVGSVIRTARDGDVLWGTGLNGAYPQMLHAPKQLNIYATRGPISYDFLRRGGFDVSRVGTVFDPGSLIDYLFQDEIVALRQHIGSPSRDFTLIPHFRDETEMRRLYPQHGDKICSVDAPFFETVGRILGSNLVVSSSLHGLIVAEALGVPAVWHRSLMGVDDLKFTDYYLGTGRYRIVKVDTLQSALRVSPMPLPTFDAAAMLATFPSFADLEAHGVIVRCGPMEGERPL
jgi:pyruvyltransferase